MSITDELRYWLARELASWKMARERYDEIIAIADRIDAEHKKAVERARMDGMDATFGSGWVQLPKDADGVPIHTCDLMEADGDTFNVMSMELFVDGLWSIRNDVGNGFEYWELHHVKPDTWERIIADAVKNGMYDHDNERIQQKLVERCRRLADGRV